MLETQDIQKLMEVLATKDDIRDLKDDVTELKAVTNNLVTAIDGLVGRVVMLNQ